jgi:hypothetical protein
VDVECVGGRGSVVTGWVRIGGRAEDGGRVEEKGQKVVGREKNGL